MDSGDSFNEDSRSGVESNRLRQTFRKTSEGEWQHSNGTIDSNTIDSMSTEAEIRTLIESTKIGKVLKEKLISFGKAKDEELKSLKADILILKHDHEEKSQNLEKSIVNLHNEERKFSDKSKFNTLEEKINILQKSFLDFKNEFVNKFNSFEKKFKTYADVVSSNKPTNFLTDINSKLNTVTEKIEAETEQKLIKRKALNVIVFNIPEATNSSTKNSLESCKKDLQVLQEVLGENQIRKHELKTLHRIGRIAEGKTRPIVVKLNDKNTKQRLLKLRNLKYIQDGTESNVYINPDRTVEELKTFKKLREEMKSKQAIAEKNNWNVKYLIRNNKVIESTNQPFRYDAQKLWD